MRAIWHVPNRRERTTLYKGLTGTGCPTKGVRPTKQSKHKKHELSERGETPHGLEPRGTGNCQHGQLAGGTRKVSMSVFEAGGARATRKRTHAQALRARHAQVGWISEFATICPPFANRMPGGEVDCIDMFV